MKPDHLPPLVQRFAALPPAAFQLLLLALAGVLLCLALWVPPLALIDIGAPGDALFLENFLPPEAETTGEVPPAERTNATTFRWSGPDSRLRFYGTGAARSHTLSLRFHGDPLVQAYDRRVRLERDGQPVATFEVTAPGWRVYQVLLPAEALSQRWLEPVTLDLVSSTYVPGSHAGRHLGIPIDWLRLTPMTSAGNPIGPPLGLALLLTWGLGLLAGVIGPIDRALLGQRACSGRALRVTGLVGLVTLGLLAWAQRDPYTLAWASTALPGVLLVGTLLAVGRWLTAAGRAADAPQRIATWYPFAGLILFVLVAHLLLLPPLPVAWRGTAAVLLLGVPGFLLALLTFRPERDPLLLTFLGLCGGLALPIPLLLGLHALPGPLPGWLLLLANDALILLLGGLLFRAALQDDPHQRQAAGDAPRVPPERHPWLALLALLILGTCLRLTYLGSAEFQGDEARPVILAAGVPVGQDEILLLNWKGPVEVLLPAGPLTLTGQIDEWTARLACALAGVGIILGGYLLARRMFAGNGGTALGLVAAAILTVDGLLIGFSRILQYQSIVVLMMLGAIWCGWCVYTGTPHPRRYLVGAAVCTAIALLAHYDGVFVLPVLVWLVVAGGWRHGWRPAQWLRLLALPALSGAGLLLSFYLPFALNERFGGNTIAYLNRRIEGGEQEASSILFNHLASYFYPQAAFYNLTFQFHTLALLLAGGLLAWIGRYLRPRWLGTTLAALLLVGSLLLVQAPERFALPGGLNWALLAFGLPLAGLLLAPATPAGLRTLLLWFTPAFVAMSFIIAKPGTHFYTISTPAALLIALAMVQAGHWLRERRWAWLQVPLASSGVALLLLSAFYLYLNFVRLVPEYYRVFPAARLDLFRASYGEVVPETSYFGFPHRDGWKVIGELYRQGILDGDYDSNVKKVVTGWYTRGVLRCAQEPAYYFAAWYEASKRAFIDIPPGYTLFGYVMVDDIRTLDIYSRAPVEQPPQRFTLSDYADSFNAQPIGSFPTVRALDALAPTHPLAAAWQHGVLLHGYDLDHQSLAPGATAALSLYWEAPAAAAALTDYTVVVELRDATGQVVASATPYCLPPAPATWPTRYINDTSFTLTADEHLPPGDYTLEVSLRHTANGAPFPRPDGTSILRVTNLRIQGE